MASKQDDTLNIIQSDIKPGTLDILSPRNVSIRRHFSGLDIVAVGYNLCSSWSGVATSFALAVASGGSVTLIYGIVLITFVFLCIGGTLAELASVYPTAGGQYHFASILAPKKYRNGVSYACGMIAVFSWIVIIAAVTALLSQGLLAIVLNFVPGYEFREWHLLLVFLTWSGAAALYNLLLLNKTTWIYDAGLFMSLSLFIVTTVTCIARSPDRPATSEVWSTIVNNSGWPDGVCFLIGTLTPQFMFAGIDGALHLAEECFEPAKVVPKAIMSSVIIGGLTAFVFAVGMSYSLVDLHTILSTPTYFPIYAAFKLASGSETAATVFLACILVLGSITLIAVEQTASRMTWAFARDNALFASSYLDRTNPRLGVPVYALLFNYAVTALVGILIVVSSTVFNAVIGSAALLQQLSFGIPAALLLYRRVTSPTFLPESRPFRLPSIVGYGANAVVVVWTLIALIFYVLPAAIPVTGTTMNYSSAVLATILLFGLINWFTHAKKHYSGPIEIDGVVWLAVTETQILTT